MNKGYSTPAAVAAYLGLTDQGGASTLTGPQQDQCTTLIGAAEAMIDHQTRRSWLAPPVTAERYDIEGTSLFLTQRPVVSIQSIQVRSLQVGAPLQTLSAGIDYELVDPNLGQVVFAYGYGDDGETDGGYDGGGSDQSGLDIDERLQDIDTGSIAFVSYTPAGPAVPADIGLAATMIAGSTLYTALFPGRLGIEAVQPDQATKVQYYQDGLQLRVPPLAEQILSRYRIPLIA